MRTPKEYTDNLKKKTITESMLLDCLYSVNKRAKNYRDKERGYRQYYRGNRYAYDKYGNVDRCQVMKEEYYSQKEKLLSVLEPTCIHKEFIGYKRIRIYDYEPEYRKNLKNNGSNRRMQDNGCIRRLLFALCINDWSGGLNLIVALPPKKVANGVGCLKIF